jgi:hypothetical protein
MMRARDALPARPVGAGGGARTWRELVARVGRVVLWLAAVIVVVRRTADVFDGERVTSTARVERVPRAAGWPDDAARAFAVEFATAYLSHASREDPAAHGAGWRSSRPRRRPASWRRASRVGGWGRSHARRPWPPRPGSTTGTRW